jgi:hypothetical protein
VRTQRFYNPVIVRFDRVAWEYPLFGEFRCDLAIGDSVTFRLDWYPPGAPAGE